MNSHKYLKELQDTISKMARSGSLPEREQLLEQFQESGVLSDCNDWFLNCNNFLSATRLISEKYNHIDNYPFECVLYTHLIRMQRYMLGLSRLSWIHDNQRSITHSIDCYYPILKSVFELFVEFCLTFAFREEFGKGHDSSTILANRVNKYTDFSRKKNNYQFYFSTDKDLTSTMFESMPTDIQDYLKKGKTHAKKVLDAMAKDHFYEARMSDVRHWFPTKDRDGKQFAKNRIGSMQWCCESILDRYSEQKGFWTSAYKTTYEMLNRYSHPVMGYDDNLRPTQERLFDLARMQYQIILIATVFIHPKIRDHFNIVFASDAILEESFNTMRNIEKKLFKQFHIFEFTIQQQPYKK